MWGVNVGKCWERFVEGGGGRCQVSKGEVRKGVGKCEKVWGGVR